MPVLRISGTLLSGKIGTKSGVDKDIQIHYIVFERKKCEEKGFLQQIYLFGHIVLAFPAVV
jgi:hypothetical protein